MMEDEKNYKVVTDLPGFKPSDVSIHLRRNALVIEGTKDESTTENRGTFHRKERITGHVKRILHVPDYVDKDNAMADFESGVLTITFPKTGEEGDEGKSIPIPVRTQIKTHS
eukprot:CAMPEP_0182420218 /NCGR_PEP_ID=MMETSP1167-20130531/4853_1 /TAXON_ID=2988 /ORGANISM="Mallomonas Sp, Strain CCMP3275" /LENGTH=111 /DNA_ID=CAMNT_0024595877 /DNA_START=253 /DNA_END=588 /DNA_ORIENTATION=-